MAGHSRIAVLGDIHSPWFHPDCPKFVQAIEKKYSPDKWISIGDEIDNHAISYHEHDPNLPSPAVELEAAIKKMQWLYRLAPEMDILESNHGSLVYRKAKSAGLPKHVLKSYRDILQAPPGWKWHFELTQKMSDGNLVYFHHGKTGKQGSLSQTQSMCSVQGHFHERFHITYWANSKGLYWDCHTGCLIDWKSLAMVYAKNNLKRPIIGSLIIINGHPRLLPMILNRSGRWTGEML